MESTQPVDERVVCPGFYDALLAFRTPFQVQFDLTRFVIAELPQLEQGQLNRTGMPAIAHGTPPGMVVSLENEDAWPPVSFTKKWVRSRCAQPLRRFVEILNEMLAHLPARRLVRGAEQR